MISTAYNTNGAQALQAAVAVSSGSNISRGDLRTSLSLILGARHNTSSGKLVLRSDTRVSEQDMYAALVHKRLCDIRPGAADKFASELKSALNTLRKTAGENAMLAATSRALNALLKNGRITRAEYAEIRELALGKSQFDSSKSALSGIFCIRKERLAPSAEKGIRLDQALELLLRNPLATPEEITAFLAGLAKIPRGSESSTQSSASSPSTSGAAHVGMQAGRADGPASNVFLWKPVSDTTRKLVILLPASLTQKATSVRILSPDRGTLLATGRYSGVGNGQRQHYRFEKAGSSFPDGAIVQIRLRDGTDKMFRIKESSVRTEMK